jgi:hypothetical protein
MGSNGQGQLFRKRLCWICGRAVTLEDCKVDEHGLAVHELCYVAKVTAAKRTAPRDDRVLRFARA